MYSTVYAQTLYIYTYLVSLYLTYQFSLRWHNKNKVTLIFWGYSNTQVAICFTLFDILYQFIQLSLSGCRKKKHLYRFKKYIFYLTGWLNVCRCIIIWRKRNLTICNLILSCLFYLAGWPRAGWMGHGGGGQHSIGPWGRGGRPRQQERGQALSRSSGECSQCLLQSCLLASPCFPIVPFQYFIHLVVFTVTTWKSLREMEPSKSAYSMWGGQRNLSSLFIQVVRTIIAY